VIAFIKRLARRPGAALLRLRARMAGRPVGLAIVYHRLGDPQQGRDEALVPALGAERFRRQVEHLRRKYRLVKASELPAALRRRRRGGRIPLAITFDDDLASHLEVAVPILRAAGAPATFFLTGSSLQGPHEFWWERLDRAIETGAVHPSELGELVGVEERPGVSGARGVSTAIEAMSPDEKAVVDRTLAERLGGDAPGAGLRESQVAELAAAGFEIGFHTRDHNPLPALSDDQLATAMAEGRAELAAVRGTDLTAIAYPHGKADSRVAEAARAAGFLIGFTTSAGPIVSDTDPMLLGRLYPSYGSDGRFAIDVARALRSP
jgi:peptidoglycan/xylan/chitin deacetylase (PgdA/CDA1 family)